MTEVVAPAIAPLKQGTLELYNKKLGSKNWKSVSVCVTEGGLHIFKKNNKVTSYDIEHCILDKTPHHAESRNHAFGLRTSNTYILFAAPSPEELSAWLETLKSAFGKKMTYPDLGQKKEKDKDSNGSGSNILFRAKKNMAGKMATSGLVKQKVMNDETRNLLNALVNIVTAVVDEKTAHEVEKQVIKTILKGYFQVENGTVSAEKDLKPLDVLLRQAFNQIDKLFAYYSIRSVEQLSGGLAKASASLQAVADAIIKIMQPHVRPDNLAKMLSVLNLIADESFLVRIWSNPNLEQDLLALVGAMNKYTMFEL